MEGVMVEIEAGGCDGDGAVVAWLLDHGSATTATATSDDIVAAALGLATETTVKQDTILATMEAQAYKYHCSALRQHELLDVTDGATLHTISADSRMTIYEDLRAVKMKEWSAIAGSITLQKARSYDDAQFCSWMYERHAHAYSSSEFWAIAASAKRSGGIRLAEFLKICNTEFVSGKGWSAL